MHATYSPDQTEHRQAAARCGLRLKRAQHAPVVLIDESSGAVVFMGSRADSWDFMRNERNLTRGAH